MQTLGICIRWGKGSHLSGDRNTEEQREGMGKKCDKLNRRKDGNTNREEGRRASVLATETTGETHRGDRWGSSFVNSTKGSVARGTSTLGQQQQAWAPGQRGGARPRVLRVV